MTSARVALGTAAVLALVRFLLTPTWPCAVVVAVALVLALLLECVRLVATAQVEAAQRVGQLGADSRHREVLESIEAAREAQGAASAALRKDVDALGARVDALTSRRAFGG